VPLDEGWLQLPIPNLRPIDPSQDANLVAAPDARSTRSVFADGYFRAKRIGPASFRPTAHMRDEKPVRRRGPSLSNAPPRCKGG
jgi:hypothetical protein